MSRRDRKKASDIHREASYLAGRKGSFEEAFPTIEDISVEVKETGQGSDLAEPMMYQKESIGEYIDCSNPVCSKGGFSIRSIIGEMVRDKKRELETKKNCRGYETSPKGRNRHRSCITFFKIKVKIKYKKS